MTNRKDWPTGVSGDITEEFLAQYREADIHYMELSPGAGAEAAPQIADVGDL